MNISIKNESCDLMKRIFGIFVSLTLAFGVFAGCAKDIAKIEESSGDTTTITTTENTTAPEIKINDENFLTGEPLVNQGAKGKRPVAVMINNIKDSLPQYGVGMADIVFEIPVEGGITRLMGVYSDFSNVPKICSVRSCRYYYPIIALGMDAIYVHWGADPSIATETLKRTGIDRLEGGAVGAEFFGRDAERQKTYSSEHTGFLDGTRLPEAIKKFGYREDRSESFGETLFGFSETQFVPQDLACQVVTLNFSKAYFSTFNFDTASQTYTKLHSGKPHIDSSTGNQLAFKNVIILQTEIKSRANTVLMDVALSSGTGKYISNGAEQEILWSKKDENSPIVLTKLDGSALEINKGKSYIAFIGKEKAISIS